MMLAEFLLIVIVTLSHHVPITLAQLSSATNASSCATEPWGRYSAAGGLYQADDESSSKYLYSFGGDTRSTADSAGGGVVVTNFRFDLTNTRCWERLADGPVAIGYRATAILLQSEFFFVFGGSDTSFQAVDHLYKYSIRDNTWEEVVVDGARPSARWRHTAIKLSDTTMLVHGGRQGNVVFSDAWLFDAEQMQWILVSEDVGVAAHRHGMAYDSQRHIVWMFGGIDADFVRHSRMYRWDWNNNSAAVEVAGVDEGERPTRRASHAFEYISEMDSLVMYGGACDDLGRTYLYNISSNQWCSMEAGQRPSLRDAMLWAMDYPNFYMYQGDVICLNVGDVYGVADVHVLHVESAFDWENIYNPRNQRATQHTEFCDGTNAGSCRVPPFFEEETTNRWNAICSRDDIPPTAAPLSTSEVLGSMCRFSVVAFFTFCYLCNIL